MLVRKEGVSGVGREEEGVWGVGREERAGWIGNSEASGSTCGSCTCRRGHAIRYDLLLSLTMTRTHTPVLVLTQTHTQIHTHLTTSTCGGRAAGPRGEAGGTRSRKLPSRLSAD